MLVKMSQRLKCGIFLQPSKFHHPVESIFFHYCFIFSVTKAQGVSRFRLFALKYASDAACTVLRVDQVCTNRPDLIF